MKYSLLVKIFYFDHVVRCTGVALCTMWFDAECHPCTLVAECHPDTSDSLRKFTLVLRKVSPQDFLPILGAPGWKLRIVFLTVVRPNGAFDSVWPKAGSAILRCDHELNFRNFDLERLWTFTPMVPKVSLQEFLALFGGLRLEITNRSFWPSCDQMVILTGMRPKSMFGLFDHCATRKDLDNPQLMVG